MASRLLEKANQIRNQSSSRIGCGGDSGKQTRRHMRHAPRACEWKALPIPSWVGFHHSHLLTPLHFPSQFTPAIYNINANYSELTLITTIFGLKRVKAPLIRYPSLSNFKKRWPGILIHFSMMLIVGGDHTVRLCWGTHSSFLYQV